MLQFWCVQRVWPLPGYVEGHLGLLTGMLKGLCVHRGQALKGRLAYAVADARAFAAQQSADAERTKRSYSQVSATLWARPCSSVHCPWTATLPIKDQGSLLRTYRAGKA